jgi:hypothetical protein
VARIIKAWEQAYGEDRVRLWIEALEQSGGKPRGDFFNEEPLES